MPNKTKIGVMILTCGAMFVSRAVAAPVGMAAKVSGAPQATIAGISKPLHVLQKLEAGDTIRCGANSSAIIVLFANGGRFQIGAGHSATIGAINVSGAESLGGVSGPSARVAQSLGGARVGAVMARPGFSHQRLQADPAVYWLERDAAGGSLVVWDAVPGAASYEFTLLGQRDEVLRHSWVKTNSIATIFPGEARKPFVWRLLPFNQDGKFMATAGAKWGIITFLSRDDAAALQQAAAPLEAELAAADKAQKPRDETTVALLAELYRSCGAYERTLELLDDLHSAQPPGSDAEKSALSAISETYQQISPYAYGQWLISQVKPDNADAQTPTTPDAK